MRRTWLTAAFVLLAACGSSTEPAPSGLDEPLRVRFTPPNSTTAVAAQFFRAEMPNGPSGPTLTIDNKQAVVFPGEQNKRVAGSAAAGSTGVAFKLEGLGTGFWVAPVLIPDNEGLGGISYQVALDFSRDVPVGRQNLQIAAVNGDGVWGPLFDTPFIFQSTTPSGAAVATLFWDSNSDLDLQIVTPSGKQIDAKHPSSSGLVDGGFPPGAGVIDRDSNASCVPDGRRQEDVVWSDAPEAGIYEAKVDMFSACGEPAANFEFRIYVNNTQVLSQVGRLISIDADNGMGPGTFITNFQF